MPLHGAHEKHSCSRLMLLLGEDKVNWPVPAYMGPGMSEVIEDHLLTASPPKTRPVISTAPPPAATAMPTIRCALGPLDPLGGGAPVGVFSAGGAPAAASAGTVTTTAPPSTIVTA